jgi:hypothetical protein
MVAVIHEDRRIADRRLKQYFNSTRAQWIEVIKAAVAARARCTDDNSKAAPGFYAWDAATTRARQIFRREGWNKSNRGGIEVIINDELKKMIAVMNTDAGTADRERTPRNRTPKGASTETVIDLNNQFEMFKRSEVAPLEAPPFSLWYLCIYDNGKTVRAELSRPNEFCAGSVIGFGERIFILADGDWEKVLLEPQDADQGQEFEINVRRK